VDDGCGNSGRAQVTGINEMARTFSRDVLYPANERKPDPRPILYLFVPGSASGSGQE